MIDPWRPVSIAYADEDEAMVRPPACEFEATAARSDAAPGTVDPDLLEIARLEVERDCYKAAEASLRERLNAMQPSGSVARRTRLK